MKKKCQCSDSQFIEAVKLSFSYSGVCRLIGLAPRGGNLRTVKLRITRLKLDISHFTGSRWNKNQTSVTNPSIKERPMNEILTENSGWTSHAIRNKLLKHKLKDYRCECCGLTEWMGQPIPLELHHINNNHSDNRLENLQILCSNCHSLIHSKKPSK
jgi:5-methylcytosine-specific restriction endonuclease McrA